MAALSPVVNPRPNKAQEETRPAEVRRRLDELLSRAGQWTKDDLRARRALRVLERLSTVEARRCLERLAAGAPEAWLTEDAKAALQRVVDVSRQRPPAP